jgi:hypothetical protein
MPTLLRSSETAGCGATIELDNAEVVFVSIAQTGVLVRLINLRGGLIKNLMSNWLGPTLYNEKNVFKNGKTAQELSSMFPEGTSPLYFKNPVLTAFANAIWHCSSAAEVSIVLNEATGRAEASPATTAQPSTNRAEQPSSRETIAANPYDDAVATYRKGDYPTAARKFRSLAEQGDAAAQSFLAGMCNDGKGVPQDYVQAAKWWRLAAEQGSCMSQFNLGVMYDRGEGVPQDAAEAVNWYHLAANQGVCNAQYNLGVIYDRGAGVPQNYVLAYKWFNLSATGLQTLEIPAHLTEEQKVNRRMFNSSQMRSVQESIKRRDVLAKRMTPAQIAEAQKLVREWKP